MAQFLQNLFYLKYLPSLNSNVSFWVLLVFGLLTSIHCMGMCGGLVLSQCVKADAADENGKSKKSGLGRIFIPAAYYNFGRLVSYTAIGGIAGGVGQVLSLPTFMKGLIPIAGGIFMLVMAVNLLGLFPQLRRFNLAPPKFIVKRVTKSVMRSTGKSPFVVGLLTGLMPCGPLQIVELYALGTKSVFYGAATMFVFTLGTVPGLFAFGAASNLLGRRFQKAALRVSAVVVAVLGVSMICRGLSLEGVTLPNFTGGVKASGGYTVSIISGNIQTVTIKIGENYFPPIEVKKGIPVHWVIQVEKNIYCDCNNEIVAPAFGIDKKLAVGNNVVEFTPQSTGEYAYTCWMGMIKSKIRVVDSIGFVALSGNTASVISRCTSSCVSCQTAASNSESSAAIAYTNHTALTAASSLSERQTCAQSKAPSAPASSRVSSSALPSRPPSLTKFTGYLIDEDCFVRAEYKNPANETGTCLSMSSCAASGYGIAVNQDDGTYKFYYFDGCIATDAGTVSKHATDGQKKAWYFINSEIQDDNISVTVRGALNGKDCTNPDSDSADGIYYPVLNVTSISRK